MKRLSYSYFLTDTYKIDRESNQVEKLKQNNDEKNKAAIIEAASGLFQKWGFNKTTMEDIAKAAGKGRSTLYYYYKSKEEIFYVFMIQSMNMVINTAKSKINNQESAEDKLRVYVEAFVNEIKKYVNLYEILRGEMKDHPQLIDKIRTLFDMEEIHLIHSIIKTGIERNEFKKYDESDINTICYTLTSVMRSLLIDLYIDNKFFYDADRINILLELLFYGMKK